MTLEDIAVANRLAHEVLGRSLDELPPQTRRLLLLLDRMVGEACARERSSRRDFRFSRREVREHTGWSHTQVHVHLERLVELEYVLVHRGGRGQSFVYELLYDGQGKEGEPFLPGLIDVEALAKAGYGGNLSGSKGRLSGPRGDLSGSNPARFRAISGRSPRPELRAQPGRNLQDAARARRRASRERLFPRPPYAEQRARDGGLAARARRGAAVKVRSRALSASLSRGRSIPWASRPRSRTSWSGSPSATIPRSR